MPRYKLTIAYDGTDFHGWQKQHSIAADAGDSARRGNAADSQADVVPESGADDWTVDDINSSQSVESGVTTAEPLRTVQGVVEDVVRRVAREPVNVLGASRTDAGVHAVGQVAAFICALDIEPVKMQMAINSRLPRDVQIRDVEIVHENFHPIGDCTSKGYRYSIKHTCVHGEPPPLFDRNYLYWTAYALDPVKMHAAAQYIVGEHDFLSFTRVNHGRESTVRTVLDCSVTATDAHHCHIDVSGTGFLYNMVRIIAGTLFEAGRGRIEPARIAEILAARDRSKAGPTLPPEGLCLMWVRYDGPRVAAPRGVDASIGMDEGVE